MKSAIEKKAKHLQDLSAMR
jgi:hypothetical protein